MIPPIFSALRNHIVVPSLSGHALVLLLFGCFAAENLGACVVRSEAPPEEEGKGKGDGNGSLFWMRNNMLVLGWRRRRINIARMVVCVCRSNALPCAFFTSTTDEASSPSIHPRARGKSFYNKWHFLGSWKEMDGDATWHWTDVFVSCVCAHKEDDDARSTRKASRLRLLFSHRIVVVVVVVQDSRIVRFFSTQKNPATSSCCTFFLLFLFSGHKKKKNETKCKNVDAMTPRCCSSGLPFVGAANWLREW